MKFGHDVFFRYAIRQAYRHTETLNAILRTATGGEVIKKNVGSELYLCQYGYLCQLSRKII